MKARQREKKKKEEQNCLQTLACGLTLQMHNTELASGDPCLTTLRPEGIVQTGCMQHAATRVGHMQLRLTQ